MGRWRSIQSAAGLDARIRNGDRKSSPPSAEFVPSPHSSSCAGHTTPRFARAGFLDAGEYKEGGEVQTSKVGSLSAAHAQTPSSAIASRPSRPACGASQRAACGLRGGARCRGYPLRPSQRSERSAAWAVAWPWNVSSTRESLSLTQPPSRRLAST